MHLSMAKWSSRLPEEPLKYVGEAVMSPKRRPVPSNKEVLMQKSISKRPCKFSRGLDMPL